MPLPELVTTNPHAHATDTISLPWRWSIPASAFFEQRWLHPFLTSLRPGGPDVVITMVTISIASASHTAGKEQCYFISFGRR